jgi:glycosyltransferase involved in cell wall biosynthesis
MRLDWGFAPDGADIVALPCGDQGMKVALVHYWLTGMRGGEKVLEALCELFPGAHIYTHVCLPERLSSTLLRHKISTTFVSRLPFASRWYKAYLPFMPMALESLDLTDYDLVISSESGPAKGVITRPDALHVCYCHSPMRYIWDLKDAYRQEMTRAGRFLFSPVAHYLRLADVIAAARVDAFIANSTFVQARIRKFYRRESEVIHPPVDTDFFSPSKATPGEYYLVAGQLVEYKKVRLAVAACTELGLPLIVAGEGPDLSRLQTQAGPTVRFAGRVDNDELRRLMRGCKALIFPGIEDFGIVPVEAMACGKPVIAFRQGGVLDSVVDGRTGVLFDVQDVSALHDALTAFEAGGSAFESEEIRAHAMRFDKAVFREKMMNCLRKAGWAG